MGQQQGFFRKHGLALEVLYTQGGGETLRTVISGAVDVGISIGTLGALGAFAKGAPIRVVGGAMIGATEFWYVPVNSPIKSLREAAGKKVAYSTTGASSNLMVLGFQELYGIKLQPVATGNPAATLTRVMSGQVDVGYSVPPFAVAELEQEQDPHHRARQRHPRARQADRPLHRRQRPCAGEAAGRLPPLPAGLSRHGRLDVLVRSAGDRRLCRMGGRLRERRAPHP